MTPDKKAIAILFSTLMFCVGVLILVLTGAMLPCDGSSLCIIGVGVGVFIGSFLVLASMCLVSDMF